MLCFFAESYFRYIKGTPLSLIVVSFFHYEYFWQFWIDRDLNVFLIYDSLEMQNLINEVILIIAWLEH